MQLVLDCGEKLFCNRSIFIIISGKLNFACHLLKERGAREGEL
jgi:hypothetical protein